MIGVGFPPFKDLEFLLFGLKSFSCLIVIYIYVQCILHWDNFHVFYVPGGSWRWGCIALGDLVVFLSCHILTGSFGPIFMVEAVTWWCIALRDLVVFLSFHIFHVELSHLHFYYELTNIFIQFLVRKLIIGSCVFSLDRCGEERGRIVFVNCSCSSNSVTQHSTTTLSLWYCGSNPWVPHLIWECCGIFIVV